jgi:hypothetical protein
MGLFDNVYIPSDRSVCLDISLRQARSLDFLACEGYHGWPAVHEMFPFVLMLFLNDIPLAWVLSGIVEILEIIGPSLFGIQGVFFTNPSNYETHAGSILGDWLINDLSGILCAALLMRLLGVPGLTEPWYRNRATYAGKMYPKRFHSYWWKIHGLFATLILSNTAACWVTPPDCDMQIPYACINIGLIINVTIQLILVALMGYWWLRTDSDYKYLWKPVGISDRTLNAFFVLWFLFILMVGLQNAQPFMPIWFIPLIGEWAQVWLAVAVWIVIVVVYYNVTRNQTYAKTSYRQSL